MTEPIGLGVIGANSFVATAAVLPAIDAAVNARVVATASRSAPVPDRWASTSVDDYDDVLAHPDVDAVYIPLPNGMHHEWTVRAAAHGKHVLCEKPLAPDTATARLMASTCRNSGVLLAEAWMTPFDRRWTSALDAVRRGTVGDLRSLDLRFTFTIGPEADHNYRWDPNQGGGALLDVGIYCIGTAVELWGPGCTVDTVRRTTSESGVDARTRAELRWPDGRRAEIDCSFIDDESQSARFDGTGGRLALERVAFTSGGPGDDLITRHHPDGTTTRHLVEPGDPYRAMVESFAAAVAGDAEWPRPVERSIELLEIVERIADTGASVHE
jgi:xylose dehydrogenase (NAD/NADP)